MTMSEGEEFDVIVVGAGPAGLACAYETAAAGLQTLVLESGDAPGAKNLTGGRLYLEPVRSLCAGLLEGAPFERPVVSETITFAGESESVSFRSDFSGGGEGLSDKPASCAGDTRSDDSALSAEEQRSGDPAPAVAENRPGGSALSAAEDRSGGSVLSAAEDRPPLSSATVLPSRLNAHFADKVSEKGGMVLYQQKAEGLVREGGRIAGVKVGPEELRARHVVAADGVLSFLAEEAGLRTERPAGAYALGMKEIIELDSAAIEERFNLPPGLGASRLYAGAVTGGLPGGGFIYTNRETVSVGIVVHLGALAGSIPAGGFPAGASSRSTPQPGNPAPDSFAYSGSSTPTGGPIAEGVHELLERFKERSDTAPLLNGGRTVEYGAHLIPEAGFEHIPSTPGIPGLLLAGDAAGFVLNTGVTLRGLDFALASGALAGKSIARAVPAGQTPETCLSHYHDALKQSFVMQQMKAYRNAPSVLSDPSLYERYPEKLAKFARDLFEVNSEGASMPPKSIFRRLRKDFLNLDGLKTLWRIYRM